MTDVSVLPELTDAEAALTSLCAAIQRKTNNKEIRQEYQTLCNQAAAALNRIRSIAETADFLRDFKRNGGRSVGDR